MHSKSIVATLAVASICAVLSAPIPVNQYSALAEDEDGILSTVKLKSSYENIDRAEDEEPFAPKDADSLCSKSSKSQSS
jgi:hypothetical protein